MRMPKKKVAGVVTVYHRGTHADVLIGKILDGYLHDGGARPNLQLVSLLVLFAAYLEEAHSKA